MGKKDIRDKGKANEGYHHDHPPGGYPQYPPPHHANYPPPDPGNYPPPDHGNYPPPDQGNYPPPNHGNYPPPHHGNYPGHPVVNQPPPQGGPMHTMIIQQVEAPQSYCILAIFVLICCCLPLGAVATYFSYSSGEETKRGNYAEARKLGTTSRSISIAGIVIGILIIIGSTVGIYFLYFVHVSTLTKCIYSYGC